MKLAALLLAAAMASPAPSLAQVVRQGAPNSPISSIVVVPAAGRVAYVAGATAPPPAGGGPRTGDTQAQTVATLTRIKELLEAQGFTMGDIVMLRVYLVADPNKGNAPDREGMTAGYKQFFGTSDQPNKPSRTTIQVAGMGGGGLVEIDAQAVHAP
jgi:enamine deaminase RidA (YjgF/YER057c/UK114 family)